MFRRWIFCVMLIGAFLTQFPLSMVDAAGSTVDEKIESIQKDVNQLKMKEDQLEFLKDETKNFRESVQKERESLFNTFNIFLIIIPIIITLIGVIIYFAIGQSKKEMKEEIKAELEGAKKELKEDISKLEGEIKESVTKLEKEFGEAETNLQKTMDEKIKIADQQISRFLEKNLIVHIEKIDALERMSHRECMYQKSRILVIGTDDQLKEMEEFELKAIRQRGINHIEFMNFNREELKKKVEQGEFDILIYRYMGDGKKEKDDPQVIEIVKLLERSDQEIPLIVYSSNWLHNNDSEVVLKYRWSGIANMPVTLLGHLFTIAHAFHKEAKIEDSTQSVK